MGRLQHLLPKDEQQPPIYQFDFGGQIGALVADVVAKEAVARLTPVLMEMVVQLDDANAAGVAGDERTQEAVRAAQAALEKASGEVEKAILKELEAIKGGLRRAVKDLREVSREGDEALREGLIAALGRVRIPDYSESLARIEALLSEEDEDEDDDPKEWDFDIQRDRNGFIRSVTAKAK